MKSVETWMPLYVADYLRDTRHLSTEEHGAYLLLLMTVWTNGGALPADEDRLRRLTGMDAKAWKASRSALLEFFTRDGDSYRHKRIDAELVAAAEHAERRSNKARAAAEARWGQSQTDAKGNAPSNAGGNATSMLGGCPSPSPIPEEEKERDIPSSSVPSPRDDDDAVSDPVSIAHSLCRTAGVSVASPKAIATAAQLVRDWQQAGATPDLMGRAIAHALPRATEPVVSLRYFDAPIRNAIALEAQGHDPFARNGNAGPRQSRGGAGGFARMVAASMGS